MAITYGNGFTPFPSPTAAPSAPAGEAQFTTSTIAAVNWGSIAPHHFDFNFGTDVCRRGTEKGPFEYRAVRVSGAGLLKQPGFPDKKFENGIILVQRMPGGEVRCVDPEQFMRSFQRADGVPFQMVEEIAFQTPDKGQLPPATATPKAA